MENKPPKFFETKRLLLQASEPGHASALFKNYTGDLLVSGFLQREPHQSVDRTLEFISSWGKDNWEKGDSYAWTLFEKKTGEVVGLLLLKVDGKNAEMHFGLAHTYWRRGLMTEAASILMRWIQDASFIEGVSALSDTENVASMSLLSRLGFKQEKILKKHLLLPAKGKEKRDSWLYIWAKGSKQNL